MERIIGFYPGDNIDLLLPEPVSEPDPWEGKPDPDTDKIFTRSCFTEGEYQQYVKRRSANV